MSYLIQIPKAIRLKVNKCRALSAPPLPCGMTCVTRPQRGLAGGSSLLCGRTSAHRGIVSGLSLRASTRARSQSKTAVPFLRHQGRNTSSRT